MGNTSRGGGASESQSGRAADSFGGGRSTRKPRKLAGGRKSGALASQRERAENAFRLGGGGGSDRRRRQQSGSGKKRTHRQVPSPVKPHSAKKQQK
jgi:hypothetical protein